MRPSRIASTSARRLRPRPETRTTRRGRVKSASDVPNFFRGPALDDLAQHPGLEPGPLESCQRTVERAPRPHQDETDAAIEHAPHLIRLDLALGLQPVEDLRPSPALSLDDRSASSGEAARQVAWDTPAGDMRHAAHRHAGGE